MTTCWDFQRKESLHISELNFEKLVHRTLQIDIRIYSVDSLLVQKTWNPSQQFNLNDTCVLCNFLI